MNSAMQDVSKPAAQASVKRRVYSEQLLGNSPELLILHQGEEYRLRRTRAGKLILTK